MPAEHTVHVVYDETVTRSLALLLESRAYHVTTYETPSAFLQSARRITPGCALIDLEMPGMAGMELLARLLQQNAEFPVIAISVQGDAQSAVRAMKAGAIDFIDRPFSGEALLHAVEAAFLRIGYTRASRETADAVRRVTRLSPRERAVLAALILGKANKVIASDLGISIRTVELHRGRMMVRLGVRQFAQAIRLAVLARIDS